MAKYARSGGKSYKITQESARKFYVSRDVGSFFDSWRSIGSASSLADALELIKADSGSSRVDVRDG